VVSKKLTESIFCLIEFLNFPRKYVLIGLVTLFACAFSFLLLIEIMKAKDKSKIECIVSSLEMSEECFSSVGEFLGDPENCRQLVLEDFDRYIEDKKIYINEKTGQRQYSTCVINRLSINDFYQDLVMLSEVLEHTKLSWTFWKYFERKNRLDEITKEIDLIESRDIDDCLKSSLSVLMSTDSNEDDETYDEGSGENSGESSRDKRESLIDPSRDLPEGDMFFDD
jgi:hypothetical protein